MFSRGRNGDGMRSEEKQGFGTIKRLLTSGFCQLACIVLLDQWMRQRQRQSQIQIQRHEQGFGTTTATRGCWPVYFVNWLVCTFRLVNENQLSGTCRLSIGFHFIKKWNTKGKRRVRHYDGYKGLLTGGFCQLACMYFWTRVKKLIKILTLPKRENKG